MAGTRAVAMVAGGVAAAVAGPGLVPPAGGGEDCLTLGQKLCPLYVFTMAGQRRRGDE